MQFVRWGTGTKGRNSMRFVVGWGTGTKDSNSIKFVRWWTGIRTVTLCSLLDEVLEQRTVTPCSLLLDERQERSMSSAVFRLITVIACKLVNNLWFQTDRFSDQIYTFDFRSFCWASVRTVSDEGEKKMSNLSLYPHCKWWGREEDVKSFTVSSLSSFFRRLSRNENKEFYGLEMEEIALASCSYALIVVALDLCTSKRTYTHTHTHW